MSDKVMDLAIEAVSASLRYELAQAERREAVTQCNYAETLLALRQIQERAAELRCQHEPMATFNERETDETRQAILRAVRYVVTGRTDD